MVASPAPSEFLPVLDVEFASAPRVLPDAIQPDSSNNITLLPATAERLWNANGEGYYDPPTIRKQRWHIAVAQGGRYKVEVGFKRGPYSRVVDVQIADKRLKANLYGTEADSAVAGTVDLTPNTVGAGIGGARLTGDARRETGSGNYPCFVGLHGTSGAINKTEYFRY